eukprot:3686743-Rhodomonas_salina.1
MEFGGAVFGGFLEMGLRSVPPLAAPLVGRLATQESSSSVRSARARRRALLGEELRQLSKVPNA